MGKRVVITGLGIVIFAVAAVAYTFFKPTAEASEPIEAIPIEETSDEEATATSGTEEVAVETEEGTNPSPTATPASEYAAAEEDAASEPTAAAADGDEDKEAAEEDSEPILFEIEQASSEARYMIDEVLDGEPTTVVGRTDQVAGQIAVDPAAPEATELGIIQINARTLATDKSRRDRAVRNRILFTDQYEYITFTPTSIEGFPEAAEAGESFTLQVTGDLTITDQTHETTWEVTVDPVSESRLEGTTSTTIAYADWGLSLPSVPFVADVSEELRLELDWVATAVE